MHIREDGLDEPQVTALLHVHLAEARGSTPSENAHALDVDGLRDPAIRFFTAWDCDMLLGMGALRVLDADHAEIKSMRTTPAARRRGVARAILAELVAAARAAGHRRLSLETGTAASYVAANALYEAAGFTDCAPFGTYPASPHNRFMTMAI